MTVWVIFEVRCPTVNNEDVRLVGSLPELGSWNPAEALPLKTSERTYPVWQTAELPLPSQPHEVVQYKYIKVFGGSVVQWEAGPNRILEPSCLNKRLVNCVDDVSFDVRDNAMRRSPARIRCQGTSKSSVPSVTTSRFASSVPSPLRMSQTPVEKSPSCIEELESILRELKELEPMTLPSRPEIRRAITAVSSAVQVERSGGRFRKRQSRSITCAMVSLLMVPLMPMIVAAAVISNVPSAKSRYEHLVAAASELAGTQLGRLSSGRALALRASSCRFRSLEEVLPPSGYVTTRRLHSPRAAHRRVARSWLSNVPSA
eukprot:TRINITY_DN107711_c0_g1_i1.p1 TRINITY_DN107711_c0_g1~~TRINITY_DN107711_c0_g1_i1.p1  ORF type:complete len:316 (-),score=39.67 TRINITY_DN107711_c0_g1_i1:15-962(-)